MLLNNNETAPYVSYPGVKVDKGGGCKAAETERWQVRWMGFKEWEKLHCGKRFPSKMKGICITFTGRGVLNGLSHSYPQS